MFLKKICLGIAALACSMPASAAVVQCDDLQRPPAGPVLQSMPAASVLQHKILLVNQGSSTLHALLSLQESGSLQAGRPLPRSRVTAPVYLAPHTRKTYVLNFHTPPVPHNALLQLHIKLIDNNRTLFQQKESFVLVPQGTEGSSGSFLPPDAKTMGNWITRYGKEAFFIPVFNGQAVKTSPSVGFARGTGKHIPTDTPLGNQDEGQYAFNVWNSAPTTDNRVLLGQSGLTERVAAAFTAMPRLVPIPGTRHQLKQVPVSLIFRLRANDNLQHVASFYLLDYKKLGLKQQINVYDRYGHLLAGTLAENLQNGVYYRVAYTGRVLVEIKPLTVHKPVCSGVFIDYFTQKEVPGR